LELVVILTEATSLTEAMSPFSSRHRPVIIIDQEAHWQFKPRSWISVVSQTLPTEQGSRWCVIAESSTLMSPPHEKLVSVKTVTSIGFVMYSLIVHFITVGETRSVQHSLLLPCGVGIWETGRSRPLTLPTLWHIETDSFDDRNTNACHHTCC
jgi:hypothetical protein